VKKNEEKVVMIKNIIKCMILVVMMFLLFSCASVMPNIVPVSGEVESKIIAVEGLTKDELYIKVNSWAVDAFNSAESVIEFQDKEAGIVKGKYSTDIVEGIYYSRIKTTLTVEVKEGKCLIRLSDPLTQFTGDALNGSYGGNRAYKPIDTQAVLDKAKIEWEGLIVSFESAMLEGKAAW
jgi:hypothetical protein